MVIRRVNPLSAAKIGGLLYALFGLVFGACISIAAVLFSGFIHQMEDQAGNPMVGVFFGAGAIVILPIFYGVMGFIVALISSALYNVAARVTGGVEVDAA